MRVAFVVSFLVLIGAMLVAQPSAQSSYTYSSPLGFSYAIPSDWEVVNAQAAAPDVKEDVTHAAGSQEQKKGVACTQVGLTARHGDPASVIVLVTLPYDCYGQQMTDSDLPGFGAGAAEGLKQTFDVGASRQNTYTLGGHHLWVERVTGNPKGQPDKHYTIELACGALKKAAVCWIAVAADDAALATFENGPVKLEDDPPIALVPAGTFKP